MKLRTGDRIRHRRRNQYGTYMGPSTRECDAEVKFDGDDFVQIVSRDQLAKVMG